MTYRYKVRDSLGTQHEGTLEANSVEEAEQQLRQDGFIILSVEEEDDDFGLFPKRVKKTDIIYATSQLSIMVDTGITLSVALESLIEQEENPTLCAILNDLKKAVESGEDFSTALARHPKYFDQTYISLVHASEATGSLGTMLERIACYLRKELETRSKVRSAMAYPAIMAIIAVGVTIFLLSFVLPKFEPMFARKADSLPQITKLMMNASHYLTDYWYAWVGLVVACAVGYMYAKRTPRGIQVIDYLKINIPVIGPMFRKVAISRSIRTLGTMVASGVSMLDALSLSAEVAGNHYYSLVWQKVLSQVTSGSQIYETLLDNALFPKMLVQMIRSGEETGKLDTVLEKVSTYYDTEVEQSLKTATSLIEPIMITVMGLIVGGIAMALLLPIFTLGRP